MDRQRDSEPEFTPFVGRTRTEYKPIPADAFDWLTIIVVRTGGAVLSSALGAQQVVTGDAVLIAAHTTYALEPEGRGTMMTTLYLDWDYVVDQVFWKYADQLTDRLNAQRLLRARYLQPAQVVRLGKELENLLPLLDELVAVSSQGLFPERYYRAQSSLFAVLDVLVPRLTINENWAASTRRRPAHPGLPRHRGIAALRTEVRAAAAMLRSDPAHQWTVGELAAAVHLSSSQFGRRFVTAYGKSPIAYLTMLRAEQMAYLLRSSDEGIAAIAHQVGGMIPTLPRDSSAAASVSRRAAIAHNSDVARPDGVRNRRASLPRRGFRDSSPSQRLRYVLLAIRVRHFVPLRLLHDYSCDESICLHRHARVRTRCGRVTSFPNNV